MWLAKYKVYHKTCLITPLCIKNNVDDYVTLLSSWKEKNRFYYAEMHNAQGKDSDINNFTNDLKINCKKLEKKGNTIFTLNEESIEKEFYDPVFDPKIIYTKPVLVSKSGYEIWEMASWEKEALTKVLKVPTFKIEIKSLKAAKLSNIFFPKVCPELSPKQKEALDLAVKEGYYQFPRKIKLEELAKLSHVKRQTFQENLRRGERKLIPFLVEGIEI
ncbi:helix-turn-helix domain-containing protein [Candidatus Woesearchaeota archaeon]|nr:helix-turn-helix domain-containing protein [Candidatus Woesearchaeota archaeon]